MMKSIFEEGSPVSAELMRWWHGLDHDRGARAELRRCSSLLDVMMTPAFQTIRQRLVEVGFDDSYDCGKTRLAVIIGLAVHLRALGSNLPAIAFSTGDRPPVSPLRFRQILAADNDDELFRRIRRVLPLAKGLNLTHLASDVLYWNDETRKKWVYTYYWPKKQTA